MTNEVMEKLGDLVKQREGIGRKLSTTYSLGRDKSKSISKSLLPMYDDKTKSYSFQCRKKESVTIFHTLSDNDTSSRERNSNGSSSSSSSSHGSSRGEANSWDYYEDKESSAKAKKKVETDQVGTSRSAGICKEKSCRSSPVAASGSKGFTNPLYVEGEMMKSMQKVISSNSSSSSKGNWLKRRTSSSTN